MASLGVRHTLPGTDYWAPEVFELDRERIFFRHWFYVGRVDGLVDAGDFLVADVAGESIIVIRGKDGELRGFYNVCRHRGSRLCDDEATGRMRGAIKCPYHAWSYSFDGRLVGTPMVGIDEVDRDSLGLWPVAVDTWAGFVFVNLADEPTPLLEALADQDDEPLSFERYRMAELRVARRIDYDVAANWKVIVENYNECLHCPTVHPELVALVPLYRKGEVWSDEAPDGGNLMRDGASSFTVTGGSNLPPFPGLSEMDRRTYYGTFQFPNLMVNLHPDAMMTYRLEPLGPALTRVVSEFFFRPETIADPDFDPSPVVDLWDTISRQDWVIVERAQLGVSSRGFRGGFYPRNDRLAFDFDERWRFAMGRPLVG